MRYDVSLVDYNREDALPKLCGLQNLADEASREQHLRQNEYDLPFTSDDSLLRLISIDCRYCKDLSYLKNTFVTPSVAAIHRNCRQFELIFEGFHL